MAKPKPKRCKPYKPKYVAVNPMSTFLGGMSGDHAEHLQKLNLRNHGAMAAIVQGRGDLDSFNLVTGALNMANVMCEMGIGNEFREAMIAARDAMIEVGKRAVRTGKFLFKGDELQILNNAMSCHDAQLENIRAIDIERAANEVVRRVRHKINTTSVQREVAKEDNQTSGAPISAAQ